MTEDGINLVTDNKDKREREMERVIPNIEIRTLTFIVTPLYFNVSWYCCTIFTEFLPERHYLYFKLGPLGFIHDYSLLK